MESAQSKIDLFSKDIKVDLQTILGREFGNMELSGGQWQSLAIARGFYRDATLLVLDEPTAAIDPIKEDYYYTLFRQELKFCIKDRRTSSLSGQRSACTVS